MSSVEHCQACGHPARDGDPIVTVANGNPDGDPPTARIHGSHTVSPMSGFYGAEVQR